MENFAKLIKISRLPLLGLFLLHFLLGSLLAVQLGGEIEISLFWLNLEWLVALFLGISFLNEYILWLNDETKLIGERKNDIPPKVILGISFLLLLFSLVLLYYQIQITSLSLFYLIQLLILGFGLIMILPPFRILQTTFGEMGLGILLTLFTSFYGYFVSGSPFVAQQFVIGFGFLFQFLAFLLIKDLKDYTTIVKFEKKTLLGQFGWEQGIFFYSSFLLISYFVFCLGIFLGLLPSRFYSLLIGIGLAIIQTINLRRIENGAQPKWRFTSTLTYLNYFYPIYSLFLLFILS